MSEKRWAVKFIPMPMPKRVCRTNMCKQIVQLEVCIFFGGRGMGTNITAQESRKGASPTLPIPPWQRLRIWVNRSQAWTCSHTRTVVRGRSRCISSQDLCGCGDYVSTRQLRDPPLPRESGAPPRDRILCIIIISCLCYSSYLYAYYLLLFIFIVLRPDPAARAAAVAA